VGLRFVALQREAREPCARRSAACCNCPCFFAAGKVVLLSFLHKTKSVRARAPACGRGPPAKPESGGRFAATPSFRRRAGGTASRHAQERAEKKAAPQIPAPTTRAAPRKRTTPFVHQAFRPRRDGPAAAAGHHRGSPETSWVATGRPRREKRRGKR
jgi:hypothetical protein